MINMWCTYCVMFCLHCPTWLSYSLESIYYAKSLQKIMGVEIPPKLQCFHDIDLSYFSYLWSMLSNKKPDLELLVNNANLLNREDEFCNSRVTLSLTTLFFLIGYSFNTQDRGRSFILYTGLQVHFCQLQFFVTWSYYYAVLEKKVAGLLWSFCDIVSNVLRCLSWLKKKIKISVMLSFTSSYEISGYRTLGWCTQGCVALWSMK